jgi:hypothetical protein
VACYAVPRAAATAGMARYALPSTASTAGRKVLSMPRFLLASHTTHSHTPTCSMLCCATSCCSSWQVRHLACPTAGMACCALPWAAPIACKSLLHLPPVFLASHTTPSHPNTWHAVLCCQLLLQLAGTSYAFLLFFLPATCWKPSLAAGMAAAAAAEAGLGAA